MGAWETIIFKYERNQTYPSLKVPTIKYCLIFKTKPILSTRYYTVTCKMYIIHTETGNHTHIQINKNSYMEPLHSFPLSENLGEVTDNIIFIRNGKFLSFSYDYGSIFTKLIRTMIFNLSKEISTEILENCLKNKLH